MTEPDKPPARRRRWLRRLGCLAASIALLLGLAAAGVGLHGRGDFETGTVRLTKTVFMKWLGFEGPIFSFWGKPMIWVEANATHGFTGIGMDLEIFAFEGDDELRSLGEVEIGGMVHGLALSGDVLYASAGDAGLAVVDITDPSKARRIVALPSQGYTFGIALDEERDRVYVTERDAGVRVFDISKRRRPRLLGTFADTEWANDVVVEGTTAFIADGKLGLVIVDFADPEAPETIGYMALPGPEPLLPPIDPAPLALERSGDVLFLASVERDLIIVDVGDPRWPRVLSSLSLPGDTMDVRLDGDLLHLAQEPDGIVTVDVSDPAAPRPIGSLSLPGSTHTLAVAGEGRLLVGLLAQGAALVDVSDPTSPRLLTRSRVVPIARSVALTRGHALVAEGPGGLGIYSLENPDRPREVARIPAQDYVYDVRVEAERAYVAGGQQGLMIVDLTDLAAPELLEDFKTPEHAFSVSLADGRAYTAEGVYQFVGVRLDEAAGLRADAVGAHTGYGMTVLALGDERLLVGNFMDGLKLMNVAEQDIGSLPFRQLSIGEINPLAGSAHEDGREWLGPRRVVDLEHHGDGELVLFASYDGGLGVLDVSAVPEGPPVIRAQLELGKHHFGVASREELAAVGGHADGLFLVDLQDPDRPSELARLPTRDRAFGVALSRDRAYVADGAAGLTVVDISDPRAPRLLPGPPR